MKILYSCLSQSWGGMEMFTLSAVEQLLKRNNEVELLCYPGSKIYEEAEKRNIKTIVINAAGYFNPLQIFKTSKIIKRNNFDLVHTQASKDLWVLVPALKFAKSKIPLIMTKQVGSFIVKKDKPHKFIYDRVTFTLAISTVIKNNLLETCPLTEDKVLLLHNGIDTKRFSPENAKGEIVRKEFGIKENEIVIGMLARFSWGKGHEEFLYAAKELTGKFDNIKFIIVGEPSRGENEYADKIKALVEEYDIRNNVIFTGFRSDTPDILDAMDIFAFPSHSEAFGIALVEAMAMGKPSVCSNSDGILDIADDGVTSYLFEKQNGNDLKDKLEILIQSSEKRYLFGKAAREKVMKNFDLDYLTGKVLEIYNKALKLV
jgi:glycosyltransferase involved in cell wall biosynthesis